MSNDAELKVSIAKSSNCSTFSIIDLGLGYAEELSIGRGSLATNEIGAYH